MKKGSIVILIVMLAFGGVPHAGAQERAVPSDIQGHWAEDTIKAWVDEGRIQGYPDGTFRPDEPITRAAFMKLANGLYGDVAAKAVVATDVPSTEWYAAEVSKALGAGYIGGYGDGTMRPDAQMTRVEVASIIQRMKMLPPGEARFTDSIPQWAEKSVGGIVKAGAMGGYSDGTFRAGALVTRAEALTALDRARTIETVITSTAGPAEGKRHVAGDVRIAADGVTLQHVDVHGDVTIGAEVGQGTVYINDVDVQGSTRVRGGGGNSVYIN